MLSALTLFGFLVTLAWIQQCFLNHLIAADLKYFESLHTQPPEDCSEPLSS
ncbi:MAG: hypothetical protein ACTS3T_03145 [Almyronema sp.]